MGWGRVGKKRFSHSLASPQIFWIQEPGIQRMPPMWMAAIQLVTRKSAWRVAPGLTPGTVIEFAYVLTSGFHVHTKCLLNVISEGNQFIKCSEIRLNQNKMHRMEGWIWTLPSLAYFHWLVLMTNHGFCTGTHKTTLSSLSLLTPPTCTFTFASDLSIHMF